MKVEIYSKDACPNCVKAMKKLESYEPIVYKLGEDISRDDFFSKFPGQKTLPQIVINDGHVGGYDALERWLEIEFGDEDF